MNPVFPRTLCSLALLTLSACSTLECPPSSPAPDDTWETEVLNTGARVKTMSTAELTAEADNLQRAWNTRRSEENRLRLGVFLAVAPPPQGDRARALSLLDVTPSEVHGRGRNHPLAQVLLPLLHDYRRLDETQAGQQQKLRELQQSSEQMRQKLDALREIEMRMLERPKPK